jgi:hypothetical protein
MDQRLTISRGLTCRVIPIVWLQFRDEVRMGKNPPILDYGADYGARPRRRSAFRVFAIALSWLLCSLAVLWAAWFWHEDYAWRRWGAEARTGVSFRPDAIRATIDALAVWIVVLAAWAPFLRDRSKRYLNRTPSVHPGRHGPCSSGRRGAC